jgi:hypothetical protein
MGSNGKRALEKSVSPLAFARLGELRELLPAADIRSPEP